MSGAGVAGRSPFPPIDDYGFLSDCETMALVAPDGAVEWLCLPRMDAPSVFGALLDRDAGHFRIGPADVTVPVDRRYVPGTMALETTWCARRGWLLVRDVLLFGPWHHADDRSQTHQRAPTDYDADHVLLREVHCLQGEVQVELECAPMFDYGRHAAVWEHTAEGYYEALARGENDQQLRISTDIRVSFEGPIARGRTLLRAGDRRFCALWWSEHPPPRTVEESRDRRRWTAHHWQHWLDRGRFPDHRWRGHLQRSALALKGLTFTPTGGMAAAATTSLPETPGGERNWDYRFTWLRDAGLTLGALYTLGFDWEADDFFYFIADLARRDDDSLQVMYGIDGRADLTEETLDHLDGYEGAQPVRTGNAAALQRQHDVWGSVVGAIWLYTRRLNHLPSWLWPIVVAQAEQARRHWREPDNGLWEVRGAPQHFTHSKVMCWLALHRGAALARMQGEHERAGQWQATADEIHGEVCEKAVDERGVLTQHYDTTALDASLLLLPMLGFLPPEDERVRRTVLAIADELTRDGLVLRYLVDETDDGLSGDEGTFTACSFWLVSALVAIGEVDRASTLCARLLSHASPLGLFAEQIDAGSGRQLGNFPQALTHLALVNAVTSVIRAEQETQTTVPRAAGP